MKNKGFTLVELAIVVVVVALIMGGILVGRDMINNARLQSIISDVDSYKRAIGLFRDKYKAFPGDMPNAETFWGTASGCPTITATAIPAVPTCNGDGNGIIGTLDGSPAVIGETVLGSGSYNQEHLRAWQQLGNAELIIGRYTGTTNPSVTGTYSPGVNTPQSQLRNNTYDVHYSNPVYNSSAFFDGPYGHVITYGVYYNTGSMIDTSVNANVGPGLSAVEALHIDTKADDGRPGTGSIMPAAKQAGFATRCTTGSINENAATYNVSRGDNIDCSLFFITGF